MTKVEPLLWWQNRYLNGASVTAPLVRNFVEANIQYGSAENGAAIGVLCADWARRIDSYVQCSHPPVQCL